VIRVVIVDDETPARVHLRNLLGAHADVQIVAEAANGLDALERITEHGPDVIFLDIEMPGLNGFEVLRELRTPPVTVFATAFDEYAVRAFDSNALDYLLKPVQPPRLSRTLDKVRANVAARSDDHRVTLRRAVASLTARLPLKITGRRGNRLILLSPKEILYAAIHDELVFLHTEHDRYTTDRTISELEQLLVPAGFVRVSRSSVVNLHHARELLPWNSGTCRIRLTNGVELDVSRDRARELKGRLR
jgi:two-component system LytT family response regulator